MKTRHRQDMLVWLALLITALIEFGGSFATIPKGERPVLMLPAAIMAILVAIGYMRLLTAPQIARCFAVAGVFWLTILLGLVMTDPLTRTVYTLTQ